MSSGPGDDLSAPLRNQVAAAARAAGLAARILPGEAEGLPFAGASFGTVVCSLARCSVHSPAPALREAPRVLKPGGMLLFSELGLVPDRHVEHWQRRLEPLSLRLAGGCHLSRRVAASIIAAGFRVVDVQTKYLPRTPRIVGWSECGCAQRP